MIDADYPAGMEHLANQYTIVACSILKNFVGKYSLFTCTE
jgi:hypothetical protein